MEHDKNDFYRPYQNEIYTVNRLLPERCILASFNYVNRCFNFNFVDKEKRRFNPAILQKINMPDFFKTNWGDFEKYIDNYFGKDKDIKTLFERLKSDVSLNGKNNYEDKVNIHYNLLKIFHSYPVNPRKYIDGVLRIVTKKFAKYQDNLDKVKFEGDGNSLMDVRFKYVELNLLTECPFKEFPWLELTFYDTNYDINKKKEKKISFRVKIENTEENEWSCEIVVSQDEENPVFYKKYPTCDSSENEITSSTSMPDKFFYNYLYYFWSIKTNKGGRYLEDHERRASIKQMKRMLVVPIYSASLPGGDFGTIIGHLMWPMEYKEEGANSKDNTERNIVEKLWVTWAPLTAQTLLKSREEALLAEPIKDSDDILKDLLSKVTFVQDWEKAAVFKKTPRGGYDLRYCFKRYFGNAENRHQDYEEIWDICKPGKKCEAGGQRCYIRSLEAKNQIGGKIIDGKCFYWWLIKDILDPLVLPSAVQEEIARYENHVLCFEFPEYTFFPPKDDKEEAITEVGEHYVNKLIPIFDKLLLKKRVLQHSVKAAVSAIISRNHSHHIGSHVTPRSKVNDIKKRLEEFGYRSEVSNQIDKIQLKARILLEHISGGSTNSRMALNEEEVLALGDAKRNLPKNISRISERFKDDISVIDLLKTRLDTYIQKKADFSAEISTEPLITSKNIFVFKEIFVPFLENTLLLDGIGANEGVRYKTMTENLLKLHVLFDGKEVDGKWTGSSAEYPYNVYPYSGYCHGCDSRDAPEQLKQILGGDYKDKKIAVPGPLGEFAAYSILENFIRNAIKHNRKQLDGKNGAKGLEVFLDVMELDRNDPDRDDFYKVQIWDNLTNPCACRKSTKDGEEEQTIGLKNMLDELIKRSIVDTEGKLQKGAWGIAEMKIMATLLSGSDNFLNMKSNLQVRWRNEKGKDHLVYEFRVMKPKEIAIISKLNIAKETRGNLQENGVWYFNNLENFSQHFKERKSISSFRFVIICLDEADDEQLTKEVLARFPGRVLRRSDSQALDGSPPCFKKDSSLNRSILKADSPELIIQETWKRWIHFLMDRHKLSNPQLVVYLQQSDTEQPTAEWRALEEGMSKSPLRLNVAHKANWKPPTLESASQILLYDRHAGAIKGLMGQDIRFYEAVDKGSSDFANLFADPVSHITALEFAEAALLNVLIMDERLAERAHDIMDVDTEVKEYLKKKNLPNRINIAKLANISLCTHLAINDEEPKPLHEHVVEKEPILKVCLKFDRTEEQLKLISFKSMHDGKKETISYDIAIIHQGVLEGFIKDQIQPFSYDAFVTQLKTWIPSIIVTSGRGIPHDIPDSAKFLPFSLLEDYVMKGGIAKYRLTRIVMDLIRRDV